MKMLSENLYIHNLDNDAGVFHYLLDAAEEEVFADHAPPRPGEARV